MKINELIRTEKINALSKKSFSFFRMKVASYVRLFSEKAFQWWGNIYTRYLWLKEPSLKGLILKRKVKDGYFDSIVLRSPQSFWFSGKIVALILMSFVLFALLSHIQFLVGQPFVRELVESIGLTKILWLRQGFDLLKGYSITEDNAHYQNLIAVHAGVGAVLVALSFFIAQELINKSDSTIRGILLLRRSNFIYLLIGEILVFLNYIWGSVNIISAIPICIIAVVTAFSLYKTISLIANDFRLKKEEEGLFYEITKTQFLKSLDFELKKRIGNNVFQEQLIKMQNVVVLNPFIFNEEDYVPFSLSSKGLLYDINLFRLKALVARFHESYKPRALSNDTSKTQDEAVQRDAIYQITLFYLSDTEGRSGKAFLIKKDLIKNEKEKKEIAKLVRKIFTIKPDPDTESEARDQMIKLKVRCLSAIKDLKSDEVERILELYLSLFREFYNLMRLYGGGFSEEQAKQEANTFPNDKIKPIAWLFDDIKEVLEHSFRSGHDTLIRRISYLPFRIVHLAIENDDHFIFQEFLYFSQLFYVYSVEERARNERLADALVGWAGQYIVDTANYYLATRFTKGNLSSESFISFSSQVLKVLQHLLKSSLDRKDYKSFNIILDRVRLLFKESYYLRSKADDDDGALYDSFSNRKHQMLFGIASWALFLLEGATDKREIMEVYKSIMKLLPQNIKDLTAIFLDTHSYKVTDYWGWDSWEITLYPEGEVHTVRTLERLKRLFVVSALNLLREKTSESIKGIALPHNRDLAFMAEDKGELLKFLDSIANSQETWSFIVDSAMYSKVQDFKSLLESAKLAQDQDDALFVRRTAISTSKIDLFKEGFRKNYTSNSPMMPVFVSLNFVENRFDRVKLSKRMGVNTIFDKTAFFDESIEWHVHYGGLEDAFDFGRSMSYGENEIIMKDVKSKCIKISKDEFSDTLSAIKTSDIVLLATNKAIWSHLRSDSKYLPEWHQNFPKGERWGMAEGAYKHKRSHIPVYQLLLPRGEHSGIFILNKSKFGKIVRYSPGDRIEDIQSHEPHRITVEEFSNNKSLVSRFIRKPPTWLSNMGSEDRQREYLEEKVLIKIFGSLEFLPEEDFQGYFLNL